MADTYWPVIIVKNDYLNYFSEPKHTSVLYENTLKELENIICK